MVRRIRLISGLVLFAFVLTHLINHALGIISLQMLETGRLWFLAVWRDSPLGPLMFAALIAHFALALWALYARRELSLSPTELLQYALGFAAPILLVGHVIGTRYSASQFGTEDSYSYVLLVHWVYARENILLQTAAIVAVWTHGCIGLHQWLRLKPGYHTIRMPLFALAVTLPLLSWLGYWVAGRDVIALAKDPDWLRGAIAAINPPGAGAVETMNSLVNQFYISFAASIALVLAARAVRALIERQRGLVRVTYPGARKVAVPKGRTILEISRGAGIPHASVCGGRGRCSTCRVRVVQGEGTLPGASAEEARVLKRVGAGPGVRLACQTRPTSDIEIMPLLPAAKAEPRHAHSRAAQLSGEERQVAILFADLRSFTQFSEQKLPYDVVFVLNRYFANMGEAVEQSGGHLDKFIGDGVMALFGIDESPEDGCGNALKCAKAMSERLADMNRALAGDLDQPLRIGIGIHAGPAIIGEMGYGKAVGLTAIGDTVNTASRLETMTKDFGAQLVVSEGIASAAGVDLSAYPRHEMEVRGRRERLAVRVIENAATLRVG